MKKFMTTEIFPEPNFTQVPNRFFEMLSEGMESSEVRVSLIMIRETYGFHRKDFKMGLNKLAEASGLSRGATKDGAEAAEKRGTFRRTNPESQGEAEWELTGSKPLPPINDYMVGSQPLYTPPTTIDPQVGVKERLNKLKDNMPISWKLQHGEMPNQDDLELEQLRNTAPKMFEKALGFSKPLPWWIGKDWTTFAEWVCAEYEKSKSSFGEYNIWRATPYIKGALANTRIRGFVTEFYDSWDMFMMSRIYEDKKEKKSHAL